MEAIPTIMEPAKNKPSRTVSAIPNASLARLLDPDTDVKDIDVITESPSVEDSYILNQSKLVLADYIYVSNNLGKPFYFQKSSAKSINKEAFARTVTSLMPTKENGKPFDPLTVDREFDICQVVDRQGYHPTASLPVYETTEGISYANTYREPKHPEYEPERVAEVERIITNHMHHLFGGNDSDNSGAILLSYLAHIIQAPDKPALWAVLLFGEAYGSGKTMMLNIVRNAIGASNYKNFDGNALKESFTSLGAMGLLHVVEEVHLNGSSRWTLLNDLKPRITNSTVKVRLMYQDAFDLERYARIVATSNYPDALPVTEQDRRWCVLQTYGFETTEALNAFKQTAEGAQHYKDLAKLIEEECGGAVKEFFQNFQINHAVFDPCQPPMTEAKTRMAHASRSDDTFLLLEAIEKHAGPDITPDSVINFTRLRKRVREGNESNKVDRDFVTLPTRKALGYAMAALGFRHTPEKFDFKVGGTRIKGVCYIHRKCPANTIDFRDAFIRAERHANQTAAPVPATAELFNVEESF